MDIEDLNNCNLCGECVDFFLYDKIEKKVIRPSEDETRFIFTVESTGALEPEVIVMEALKILKQKVNSLFDKMGKHAIIMPQ